jgi:hypothetical protein
MTTETRRRAQLAELAEILRGCLDYAPSSYDPVIALCEEVAEASDPRWAAAMAMAEREGMGAAVAWAAAEVASDSAAADEWAARAPLWPRSAI